MKLSSEVELFKQVSIVEKLLFTKHLAVMLKSGIPLSESVKVVRRQTKSTYFRKVLSWVEKDLRNGQLLHVALGKYPRIFDSIYLSLVKIGEESGNLEENLRFLADQQRKGYEFKKKVQSAMLYPTFILGTAVVVGGGISFFVMPKLVSLFESLDVELPLATKVLLWFAYFMRDYNVLVFGGIIIFVLLFRFFVSMRRVKPWWHRFLLSVPKLGVFLQQVELAAITRNLGIMLKSGLPILMSVRALEDSMRNVVYKGILHQVAAGVEEGRSVEDVFVHMRSAFIPAIVSEMVGVGERTGKIEDSLLYLGDFFEEEVDTASKDLANILEPVILLTIGVVVAFVAMSILSPIYQLTGGIRARP